MCDPIQDYNDGTGYRNYSYWMSMPYLYCNPVQYTVFPLETLATKEHFTIPVEILINLWFAINKNI